MRLVLIGPVYPYRGGIAHYTTHLALAFRALEHECQVISFRRQYPSWLYPGGNDKDPSHPLMQIEANYLLDPIIPWTWWQCTRYIHERNPDLVVLQWWTTFWALPFAYVARWLRRHHVSVVYLVHNVLPHEEKPWDRLLARIALSSVEGFIVQSQPEKERLVSLIPKAIIQVSPHPVYTMFTNHRVNKIQARQELGLPLNQPILLFFGIVRPYKGLKYLLEALALLKEKGVRPFLLIAGDFWEERIEYEKQIHELGLSEQVKLDDRYIPDEQAALMFSAADGLVAPYIGGTQSGVAGIAQGFSLPMIVTEQIAEGLSEQNNQTVHIIPPADAHGLADAIQKLLANDLGKTSKPVQGDDNWWRMVGALIELYELIKKEG